MNFFLYILHGGLKGIIFQDMQLSHFAHFEAITIF